MEFIIPPKRLQEQPFPNYPAWKIQNRFPGLALPPMRLWLAVGLLFLLLVRSGPLLRAADPAAAVVDLGVISLLLLALLALICFIAVGHWLLGLLWPVLREYPGHHLSPNFKSLRPWQKIFFYFAAFFALLYAFIAVLAAVM